MEGLGLQGVVRKRSKWQLRCRVYPDEFWSFYDAHFSRGLVEGRRSISGALRFLPTVVSIANESDQVT